MTSARGFRWGLLSSSVVLLSLTASPALAETKQASVGNYWFEDDARRDRTKIIVNQGDQLTFTIREGIYPAHTVDVDELGIHSPDLLLGSTFTTPQLNTAGTFRLYCRPHEQRGHVTTLFVRATTAATSAPQPQPQAETPAPSATTGSGPEPGAEGPPSSTPPPQAATPAPQPATPAPQRATPAPHPSTPERRATPAAQPGTVTPPPATPAPKPATPAPRPDAPLSPPSGDAAPPTTLTPVGVGRADHESLARVPEPEPGSLDDLIGRREPRGAVPWTRALWLLMVAAAPILGAAGYALSREAGRHPR